MRGCTRAQWSALASAAGSALRFSDRRRGSTSARLPRPPAERPVATLLDAAPRGMAALPAGGAAAAPTALGCVAAPLGSIAGSQAGDRSAAADAMASPTAPQGVGAPCDSLYAISGAANEQAGRAPGCRMAEGTAGGTPPLRDATGTMRSLLPVGQVRTCSGPSAAAGREHGERQASRGGIRATGCPAISCSAWQG